MLHPVIDKIGVDTQNEVVKEEKRQSYDRPYGKLLKVVSENIFKVHPYKDENIGKMEDLDAATLDEFMAYFDKYYGPSNAVLVVAGDIDIDQTKALIGKYFSEIKSKPEVVRDFPKEAPITESIKVTEYDKNVQIPMAIAAYRTPGFKDRDAFVLDMISTYLSGGKSSVLYKKLVDDKKLALQAAAINLGQVDYSVFALISLPLGDVELDTLISEIDEEIVKMQTELISERDYQKLLNQFESSFVMSNASVDGIASSLATYYLLYDNVNLINELLGIYRSITREEIQAVAKKYLNPNQRVEIDYLPGEESTN
jgi:predicted Zn-dependent peptidase